MPPDVLSVSDSGRQYVAYRNLMRILYACTCNMVIFEAIMPVSSSFSTWVEYCISIVSYCIDQFLNLFLTDSAVI